MRSLRFGLAIGAFLFVSGGHGLGQTSSVDEPNPERLGSGASRACERAFSSAEIGDKQDVLRNIGPISVVIEELGETEGRAGLTEHRLQTDVELRLRKAGVVVVDEEDSDAEPWFYVNVGMIHNDLGFFVYGVNANLRHGVLVGCDPPLNVDAIIWEATGHFGIVGEQAEPTQAIRETVIEAVDEFLNDYLAANPSRP